MKLSEMTTKQAAACMAELAAPIEAIAKHPKMREMLEKRNEEENASIPAVDLLAIALPVLCRDCFDDTAKVLAVLTGKTAKEIASQPIRQTIRDARDVFDADLASFFS